MRVLLVLHLKKKNLDGEGRYKEDEEVGSQERGKGEERVTGRGVG